MTSWCSAADVKARVQGTPSDALAQEFADQATSLLYTLSGRRFGGEATVVSVHEIDSRGYVKLTMWVPVRAITEALIDDVVVPVALSPGGTYAVFDLQYARQIATMTLEIGQNPPASGKDAAAALAAELLRADSRYTTTGVAGAKPGDTYATPRPISIARQGVTYSYADPATLTEKNLTGVYEVDLFLRAANPDGMRHQPKVVTA
jgi:hypothetical protein